MALLWSIKGREFFFFFFFNVPYLFLFLIDLRKAEVYAGLIKGEKAHLISVFSFLNQLCRGILSLSSQENFKGWVRYYIYNFVISKITALSTMLCIVGAQ